MSVHHCYGHGAAGPVSRRSKARISALGVTSVFAALLLAACSGTAASNGSGGRAPRGIVGPVTTYGVAHGDVASATFDLPLGEPNTLNPPNTAFYSSQLIADNLCDPLIRLNPNYTSSPYLATLSKPNPVTLVFNIRRGVRFWDGGLMTANDVAYSLEQTVNPHSVIGPLYTSVKSIDVTGQYQVTIHLKHPDALVADELGGLGGAIVQASYARKAGKSFGSAKGGIMCSGPYELAAWHPGNNIVLTANPHYWNPRYRAHIKTITLDFVTNSTTIAQALLTGQMDGAYEIPPAIIPALARASSGHVIFGTPAQEYLSLSVANPGTPLANATVRKALFMTINRADLIDAAYHGSATPNYTDLVDTAWDNAHTPPAVKALWQTAYQGFIRQRRGWGTAADIAAAKKMVASSGYHGQPIVLGVLAGDATDATVAQIIQAGARQAGLNVQIRSMQPLAFDNASVEASARAGLSLLLALSYNGAPNPLEQMQFDENPISVYNYDGFKSPTVLNNLAAAFRSTNPIARAKFEITAQQAYEQGLSSESLLQLDEVLFLNKHLCGATASFAYLNNASLAAIGACG